MIALITGITVNIVHMGNTIAQKGAHVVKDGKRHKDVMLLLLGIPPKFIDPHFLAMFFFWITQESSVSAPVLPEVQFRGMFKSGTHWKHPFLFQRQLSNLQIQQFALLDPFVTFESIPWSC